MRYCYSYMQLSDFATAVLTLLDLMNVWIKNVTKRANVQLESFTIKKRAKKQVFFQITFLIIIFYISCKNFGRSNIGSKTESLVQLDGCPAHTTCFFLLETFSAIVYRNLPRDSKRRVSCFNSIFLPTNNTSSNNNCNAFNTSKMSKLCSKKCRLF